VGQEAKGGAEKKSEIKSFCHCLIMMNMINSSPMKDKKKTQGSEYLCKHCGYAWLPKKAAVKCCPRCKSYKWNEEKKVA
jgi:rubrerythrin